MIRRPPRSTLDRSSAASDVYKRQGQETVARANFYPLTSTQVAKNRQELGLAKGAMVTIPPQDLQVAEQHAR